MLVGLPECLENSSSSIVHVVLKSVLVPFVAIVGDHVDVDALE